MSEIVKFAFIKTENLDRKSFKVPQAYVAIDVKGATDPLTHQKARDAVHDLFVETQKAINDDIAQRDLRISRMGVNERKLKRRGEIDNGNRKIEELLATFKKEALEQLAEWRRKEEERSLRAQEAESRENWRGVSFVVNFVWTGLKAGAELVGMFTEPTSAPGLVNSFVAGLLEIKGLFEDYAKIYADCPTMRKKVKDGLTSMKSKGKPTKSDVEGISRDLGLLEDKLLVLETKSKAMSSRVTSLISAMPKKGSMKPEAIKKAEDTLHECLTGLVSASEEIDSVQKYVTLVKKNLGLARANAKNDTTYGWASGWALTSYQKINDYKDFALKPGEWVTWVDGAIKFFSFHANWKIESSK